MGSIACRLLTSGTIDERAPRHIRGALFVCAVALALAGCAGARREAAPSPTPAASSFAREEPFVVRSFRPYDGTRWIGNAIAYGPHRDGQRPGGPDPTRAELRQDLELMLPHWNLLRVYGSAGPAESLLAIIEEERLPMKVVLGVWIAVEEQRDSTGRIVERFPAARAANRREIDTAVRLAHRHPGAILALSVGNETQVFWSAHRLPADVLIGYLREARSRTLLPVSTADDFNFWNKPESRAVAREVDFVMVNMHPLWNGVQLEDAMEWTARQYESIRAFHPDRDVVLAETGWATAKHSEGEQATLIRARPDEAGQKEFRTALEAWVERQRVTTFFFEAFDENWKGGPHPDEVEKHWGLFRADRTPKAAMAGEGPR